MPYTFNPFTGNFDVVNAAAEDLNTSNLRFEFQVNFPVAFTTNAKLYGEYLFIISANSFVILDVSNPFGPFLAGQVAGASSAFNLRQAGNNVFTFEPNRLRVYDVTNPGSPSLLYGPTAAAGNVRSGSDGEVVGNYVYTYKPSTTEFHVIAAGDPTLPVEVSTISSGAFTNLQYGVATESNVTFISGNGILQAYDVTNPESITLLSTLTLTGLSSSIDRILSMKSLGSFLYCSARLTGSNQPALLIVNKTTPTAMTEASITPLGSPGDVITTASNLELFFPFCAVNYSSGSLATIEFYDVRDYTAPTLSQQFVPGTTNFTFSTMGNNFYDIGFTGVDAYILFGTNVSQAFIGSAQVGRADVYGEVSAGFVNTKTLSCRGPSWFQSSLMSKSLSAKDEVIAYRYRQIMRYLMMMGS